jgi:hypothetical protein
MAEGICAGCEQRFRPGDRPMRVEGEWVHNRTECVEAALEDDGT